MFSKRELGVEKVYCRNDSSAWIIRNEAAGTISFGVKGCIELCLSKDVNTKGIDIKHDAETQTLTLELKVTDTVKGAQMQTVTLDTILSAMNKQSATTGCTTSRIDFFLGSMANFALETLDKRDDSRTNHDAGLRFFDGSSNEEKGEDPQYPPAPGSNP